MEENFKEVIEQIKESSVDEEETKKYILAIKKVVRKAYETCKDEQTEEEILQDYLEEYDNDLKFRGEANAIFCKALMYGSYKRILSDFKGNKSSFDSVLRESKKREEKDNTENLAVKTDVRESMISAVRYIIRTKKVTKEKDILEAIAVEKAKLSEDLKSRMIHTIHSSLILLNEYGFIDEYIEEANKELEKIGLEELQYVKRNPIADRQYDENGQLVVDVEDIGVLDTFFEENLQQMSIEDLETVTAFWESKYLQERVELSKAMSTIKTLDLWDIMLHEDDSAIEDIDNERINAALKKDLAITYLCRKDFEVTGKMKKQYKKFMKEQNLQENELSDEVNSFLPEISNLEGAASDVSILECLIIYQLMNKEMKIKKWGVIENKPENDIDIENYDGVTIAIENRNFRGPLLMGVSNELIRDFTDKGIKVTKYEKELNEAYCNVMSNLYLPTNNFFNNLVKKAYNQNPESKLLADLAGKKVRAGEER